MYSFERDFVSTLHSQFLTPICWCPVEGSEYVTRGSTISSQFDGAITEERCYSYSRFISESGGRSVMHIAEDFHPLTNQLAKAYSTSIAINCLYYYPPFGSYNCLVDIFFLQDYWKVVHQFGLVCPKNVYLSECKEWVLLDFLKDKHCDFLLEESVFLSAILQKHLSAAFSFRPLLSVIFSLLGKNNGEADCEIIDYFLWKYYFNLKESICLDRDFFDNSFLEFGLILVLFSLFIKLASAPFHIWSLDVYEGVPISSAFFFAVLTKLSIFVLLIRLCYYSFLTLKSCWQFYSLSVGLFSIFVGSFGGLREKRLKTLLAYSSISHMGYALIAFSTSTFIGVQMLLLYVFIYMLSGLSIWYVVILLVLKKPKAEQKYSKELSDIVLLRKSNLMLAISLSFSIFSVAGIPPLVGFFAKLNVLLAVVGDFFYLVGFLSILCSVVSTFYYIRIVKVLYFENLLVGKLYYPIKTTKTVFLGVLVFLLIFFFLNPTILYLVNYKSVLSLL